MSAFERRAWVSERGRTRSTHGLPPPGGDSLLRRVSGKRYPALFSGQRVEKALDRGFETVFVDTAFEGREADRIVAVPALVTPGRNRCAHQEIARIGAAQQLFAN